MTNSNLTCAEFDAALPDHLEGALDEPLRATVQKHLSECVRCASLMKDVEKIRKDAAALPDLVPSRDLWQGIEARIAAPVIPLAARAQVRRRFAAAWIGVAAAVLIVATAGVTYTLTARSFTGRASRIVVVNPPVSESQPISDSGGTQTASNPMAVGTGGAKAPSAQPVSRAASIQSAPATSKTPASFARGDQESSDLVYSREIAMLQKIVTERKTQLDSATVAIIERNLQIIDAAIEQSKAALAKDPASRLLGAQLTHALDKKVELLRTAALLPAST